VEVVDDGDVEDGEVVREEMEEEMKGRTLLGGAPAVSETVFSI
jgi:hypothetical protein